MVANPGASGAVQGLDGVGKVVVMTASEAAWYETMLNTYEIRCKISRRTWRLRQSSQGLLAPS